jgi:hypothetical protein
MSEPARIGMSAETGEPIFIGDIERRSGLYVLGKPGMGKSALLVNLMGQDIENEHGLFFLDPHGDAITDLTDRFDVSPNELESLSEYILLLNPTNETHSFGINPLACRDITSLNEREDTYKRAYNIFSVLWEGDEPFGPWLQLILEHTLYVFIENPEYTLAEVPLFLTNAAFRNHLLKNVKYNREVADFWHYEFGAKRERDQEALVQAALTRVRTLLAHRYVRDIVGQKTTTINFAELMEMRAIILVNLPANLASDSKRFIGAILISELVHAVRNRTTDNRGQFCIFVDEFQNFASDEDFGTLITEARKFGVATTIAHQERFGQFANNPKLLGATAAAANKIFFQLTVKDAQELAPEFAENAPDTRTRLGGQLINSPHAIEDIWEKGYPEKNVMYARQRFFWVVDLLKTRPTEDEYTFDPVTMPYTELSAGELHYSSFNDWNGYRTSPETLRRGISLLNKFYYDSMQNGFREAPVTNGEVDLFLEIVDCFSGVFGWRPTMEAYIPQNMREEFVRRMHAKQDNEIMDMRRRMEQNMLPRILMYHARTRGYAFTESREGKELELQEIIKRDNPGLLRKWIVEQVPNYFLTSFNVYEWTLLGSQVFNPTEMQQFIGYTKRDELSKERPILRELVRLASDRPINKPQYDANVKQLSRQYHALMAYTPMALRFGMDYLKLPETETDPYLRLVSDRTGWQLNELQQFVVLCLRFLPSYLSHNPIKTQSAQYEEEPKREKTQGEMIDIMGQELANLPRFKAYAKAIQEFRGEQIVIKQNIQTYPLVSLSERRYAHEYSQPVRAIIEQNTIRSGYCIAREAIEEEIRERQENWRRRRGNEPHPPTQTGGNTLPTLPTGHTGSDPEPPPTHTISERAPEEKPRGNSAATQLMPGRDDRVGARVRQRKRIIEPSSALQKHRENEIATPLEPPFTTLYESMPSRLSSVPDLQTRQNPALTLESLKFYESDKGDHQWKPHFRVCFPQETTRFVRYKLTVRNRLYKVRDHTCQVVAHYYNPDGSLLETIPPYDWVIKANREETALYSGRSWEEPGHWEPGTYRIEILIDGVKFAEGSFTIESAIPGEGVYY